MIRKPKTDRQKYEDLAAKRDKLFRLICTGHDNVDNQAKLHRMNERLNQLRHKIAYS